MKAKATELEDKLVVNALALDGSASGEHGIGIHKLVPERDSQIDLEIRSKGV
jgi:FAD/FMN-containing dehydrogenase